MTHPNPNPSYMPECKDKWIWYITNGHFQCSECICYPEIGDAGFQKAGTYCDTDCDDTYTEKYQQFTKWARYTKVLVYSIRLVYNTKHRVVII